MADRLTIAYRARVDAVRAAVERKLVELYGERVDAAAIKASFEAFIADADVLIAGGQATAAALAESYLEQRATQAGIQLELDDVADVVGTTRAGGDLASGMAAFAPMVLGQIAGGRTVGEALDYGRFLATTFADAEVTGAVDRIHDDSVVRRQLTGWRGTVSPAACDACQANAGEHDPDWTPYRHGNCDCVIEPVFSA